MSYCDEITLAATPQYCSDETGLSQEYSYRTRLRTRPAFWAQLHTCQCLRLQRLQRYRVNDILLTQRNKQTYKHLPKYLQSPTWWSTYTTCL